MPPARLGRLLDHLIQAATSEGQPNSLFLSALVGSLSAGRSHHSEVHAIPARLRAKRTRPAIFLEVHDTQPHLSRAAPERLHRNQAAMTSREAQLLLARSLARDLGVSLFLDSTPGCGNQALLVFDAPPGHTSNEGSQKTP